MFLLSVLSLTCGTFDTTESAIRCKNALQGADIYSGCCTLKIEFARVSTSFIFTNIFKHHFIQEMYYSIYMFSLWFVYTVVNSLL